MRADEPDCPVDIALVSTGGTIDKTYDPLHGVLRNDISVLEVMLAALVLEGVRLHRIEVMNKDSGEMTAEDHAEIARVAVAEACVRDGVVIVHGTDTLTKTGQAVLEALGDCAAGPIILTGAMQPWILRTSDAQQNLTEALLAVQLLDAGVFVCMHNRVLRFPGIRKDRDRLRFVYSSVHSEEG